MLKRISLTAVFCLIAFAAVAAEQKFENFTVDLPSGWEQMGETVQQAGVEVVVFANTQSGGAVVLTFAPTDGTDFKAAVEQTKQAMAAQGMSLEVTSETDNKVVFEGKQSGVDVKLTLTVDADAKQLGTMVYSGNVKAGEAVGKAIKTTNPKLSFN